MIGSLFPNDPFLCQILAQQTGTRSNSSSSKFPSKSQKKRSSNVPTTKSPQTQKFNSTSMPNRAPVIPPQLTEQVDRKKLEEENIWNQIERQEIGIVPIKSNERGFQNLRLFVSSTFADMHAEREYLMAKVIPVLKQFCLQRKLVLLECDLRWGVPKDTNSGKN